MLFQKLLLKELQKEYIAAGSDILYAPTFGCNRIKLSEYHLEEKLQEMNEGLVGITREAIEESNCKRPGDIKKIIKEELEKRPNYRDMKMSKLCLIIKRRCMSEL